MTGQLLNVLLCGIEEAAEQIRGDVLGEVRREMAPVWRRLDLLERGAGSRLSAGDSSIARIVHEAQFGEWRPWEWAEEMGIDERDLLERLARERR